MFKALHSTAPVAPVAAIGERWVLVTSAYHMPRAMGVFTKAGLTVEAYPVDFYSAGNWKDFVRPAHRWSWNFSLADDASKEWIGLIAYHQAGYTDRILPSPWTHP